MQNPACLPGIQGGTAFECVETDTQGFIAWTDSAIYVVFRGTSSKRDLLTDLKIKREVMDASAFCRVNVHRGFKAAINSVIDEIRQSVCLLRDQKDRELVITGHSLGGALAMLCAWHLECDFIPVNQVITFGQPRVGDAAFARHYDSMLKDKTFRVVHDLDAITRIVSYCFGYEHSGHELFIDVWLRLTLNPSLAYKLLSDGCSIFADFEQRRIGLATDHFMERYQKALDGIKGVRGIPLVAAELFYMGDAI